MNFVRGQRVYAGGELGTVIWQRRAPINADIKTVSVLLDKDSERPGCTGTMFKLSNLQPVGYEGSDDITVVEKQPEDTYNGYEINR